MLAENFDYLSSNSVRYDSAKLKKYAEQQQEDKDNMKDGHWRRQRKIMRKKQFGNRNQQKSK